MPTCGVEGRGARTNTYETQYCHQPRAHSLTRSSAVNTAINAKFPMRRTAASSADMPACSMAKNPELARTTLMIKRTNGFPLRAAAT